MDNKTMESQVIAMHEHFGIDYVGPPRRLSKEERQFRLDCLQEELDEYEAAETLVEEYDALLDLLVFLLGTFHRQGFPVAPGLDVVIAHNKMKKVGRNAKRGDFAIDLVKPPNWIGPENVLRKILDERSS